MRSLEEDTITPVGLRVDRVMGTRQETMQTRYLILGFPLGLEV
ncbi:hypothetical protein QUB27_30315 [Microcoleus sp. AT8-B6]